MPSVSVVLPVYNCPGLVTEAIESILRQTWEDFELILIDDGSTDETLSVLKQHNDPRIRLVTQSNRGLAATLNRGIELARGRYIARQDQDDISYPERFAKQVAYLEANTACALVGTWAEIWRENARTRRRHKHPSSNSRLKYELLLNNPFVHSSVMLRRSALEQVGGYATDQTRQPPEDYELWSRLARQWEVANIPEVLHVYREVEGSMSREGLAPFVERLVTITAENIAHATGLRPSNPQVMNIASLVHGAPHRMQGKPDLAAMVEIFRRAAESVAAPQDRKRLGREAQLRVDSLRFRYPELFGTGFLARKIHGALRRAALVLAKVN